MLYPFDARSSEIESQDMDGKVQLDAEEKQSHLLARTEETDESLQSTLEENRASKVSSLGQI